MSMECGPLNYTGIEWIKKNWIKAGSIQTCIKKRILRSNPSLGIFFLEDLLSCFKQWLPEESKPDGTKESRGSTPPLRVAVKRCRAAPTLPSDSRWSKRWAISLDWSLPGWVDFKWFWMQQRSFISSSNDPYFHKSILLLRWREWSLVLLRWLGFCNNRGFITEQAIIIIERRAESSTKAWYSLVNSDTKLLQAFPNGTKKILLLQWQLLHMPIVWIYKMCVH